ncbi:MAG: hypothetical protein M3Y72_23630 [Acidobacteriota bacterium]|nr:hypothetical protein [Acidobacteriota bacterium]
MTADEKIAALYAESNTLSPEADKPRLLALYSEIASLIDRDAKPKKWAAFRMMSGRLAYPADLVGTLQAFRDALPHWDVIADHDAWAECKSYIGFCLFLLGRTQPPENEEAIECLESSLKEFPDGTPEMSQSLSPVPAVQSYLSTRRRRQLGSNRSELSLNTDDGRKR